MPGIPKLLFVDANIWLDFYRARTDAALSLLKHLETISERIIVTHQLEMEFKKNRQNAILEGLQGLQDLKSPLQIQRPGLFSDAKEVKAIQDGIKAADARVKKLRARYIKALRKPTVHDPVFKICQRIFHKQDDLVLTREDMRRHAVRRKAFRRFLLGCPPRKKSDTSIGDAVNWEWMIDCAIVHKAELVIVSRDSDYGITIDGASLINDHLAQEFSERVSKKRKVTLFTKLSDALKLLRVHVTSQEEQEEKELARLPATASKTRNSFAEMVNLLAERAAKEIAPVAPNVEQDDASDLM
jgi:PIN domain